MSGRVFSGRLVHAVVLALPPGEVRERYRQEFLAELSALGFAARAAFTFGIVIDALALRGAVGGDSVPLSERDFSMVRKPLLCRLHVHFRHRCVTADGVTYQRCRRCGDDQYEFERGHDPSNVAGNIAANIIGGSGVGGGGA